MSGCAGEAGPGAAQGAPLPRVSVSREGLCRLLGFALLGMFLVVTFIGLNPLADIEVQTRAEGNIADRLVSLAMGGLAFAIILLRWRLALMLLRQSWLIWLMVGWCVLSVVWSMYPGFTIRRTFVMCVLTAAAFALALNTRNTYRLHTMLALFLAFVMALNIVATILFPSIAITEIGVRGIYGQKNMSGQVAVISAFAIATWMSVSQRPLHVVIGLGGLGVTGLFLLMTGSRTSTALAVGLTLTVPLVMRFLARGPRERRNLFMLGLFGLAFAALGFLAVGMTLPEILKHSVGDPTLSGRTDIWEFALIEIAHRPWLGAGYGAFWDVGLDVDPVLRAPPGTFLSQVKIGYLNQAHNGYLEVMLHVGIIGLVLALAAVAQSVYQALYLCLDRTTSGAAHALHLFCFLVLVFYLGNNLMEATLFLRGQMLNNIAMLVMFLLHRVWLDRLIGQRLAAREASGAQPMA